MLEQLTVVMAWSPYVFLFIAGWGYAAKAKQYETLLVKYKSLLSIHSVDTE